MRETEFRGKPTENNTTYFNNEDFAYGSLLIDKDRFYICLDVNEHIKRDDYEVCMIEIIPETIGQYTGLKDKNGKKIFEGDIVKDQYCIYEVVYDGNGYYAKVVELLQECGTQKGILYNFSDYKDLEVIGNIYENPDLLEKVDD